MPKKQKDGRYRAKVTPAPGEKPVYVSARTLRELNEKKQYVLTHYRDGLKPRDITFQALVVEWFEVIKRPRIRSRSTLQNYRNIINAHVLPYFPPQQLLRAVRRADLQRCLDACAGMSSIIGSLTRSVLVHAVRYALTENLLDVDISAALMLPVLHRPGQNRFHPRGGGAPSSHRRFLPGRPDDLPALLPGLPPWGNAGPAVGRFRLAHPHGAHPAHCGFQYRQKQRLHPGPHRKPPLATAGYPFPTTWRRSCSPCAACRKPCSSPTRALPSPPINSVPDGRT